MRLHIELGEDIVAEIDRLSGPRGRSRFIRAAIDNSLRHERRRRLIRSARGQIRGAHDWDEDLAGWVRRQRRSDSRRTG